MWHLIYAAARFATVALLQGKDRCCLETVGVWILPAAVEASKSAKEPAAESGKGIAACVGGAKLMLWQQVSYGKHIPRPL